MKKIMIEGRIINLVEVTENDSMSILSLRNDPSISKFLSGTGEVTNEQQQNWIRLNRGKVDGYYWTIRDKFDKVFGTLSLYNVTGRQAEFGRYICTNSLFAIEAELLLIEFGFRQMRLEEIYCRTVVNNEKVWRQHNKFGFEDECLEDLPEKNFILKRQVLTKEKFDNFDYSNFQILLNRFS